MVSPNVALNLFSSSILELLCASNEKYYSAQTSCLQGASGELRGGVGQATRGCRTSHIRGHSNVLFGTVPFFSSSVMDLLCAGNEKCYSEQNPAFKSLPGRSDGGGRASHTGGAGQAALAGSSAFCLELCRRFRHQSCSWIVQAIKSADPLRITGTKSLAMPVAEAIIAKIEAL